MERKPEEPPFSDAGDQSGQKLDKRREIQEKIRFFQAKSVRGLWAFSAFLVVSIGALYDFRFIPSLPEKIAAIIGPPPSSNMISGLLVLYSFSAIILILSRMMKGTAPARGLVHVFYIGAFYGFYHLAGTMDEYFWAVFASGFTIMSLETYQNMIRYMPLIRAEREKLSALEGKEKQTDE